MHFRVLIEPLRKFRLVTAIAGFGVIGPLATPAAAAAQDPLPFEALGKRLLEAADADAPVPPTRATTLLARAAPLHERITLGAIELWVPKRALDEGGKLDEGPRARDVQATLVALLELERAWLRRMTFSPTELDSALIAIDELASWAKALKRVEAPSGAAWTQALQRIERPLLLSGPERRLDHLVVILAPTRAHFLGMLGLAGLAVERERTRLWRDEARRSSGEWFGHDAVLVPSCVAPRADDGPLASVSFDAEQTVQWVVHFASHLLSVRTMPHAPTWWNEGLALCDTIGVAGSDETLCTGFAPKSDTPASLQGNGGSVLVWVTRDVSPFRGAAVRSYFREQLRKARTPTGFMVPDLEREKPACDLPGPFLGEGTRIAAQVTSGSTGVKRGFAEFYRAYCGGFVHWLDARELGDHSLLSEICRELAQVAVDPKAKASPLYEVVRLITDKTLGAVYDEKRDIEGEFMASLAR